MSILCRLFRHDYDLVTNAHHHREDGSEYRVGLWQCKRCKLVVVDSPCEYVNARKKPGAYHRILSGE